MMVSARRFIWPLGAGLTGSLFLTMVYLSIVSLAESPQHAVDLFLQDKWIVSPIIVGFGIQVGLYVVLKKRLFIPTATAGPSGAVTSASSVASTAAMAACCAHHVTDVLPVLGLAAASTFLAQYRIAFMWSGLITTILGIAIMLFILFRARRNMLNMACCATSEGV